jgi:hypothetical protein
MCVRTICYSYSSSNAVESSTVSKRRPISKRTPIVTFRGLVKRRFVRIELISYGRKSRYFTDLLLMSSWLIVEDVNVVVVAAVTSPFPLHRYFVLELFTTSIFDV